MYRSLYVVCALVFLSGCAQTVYWTKPGGNQQLFNQAQAHCHNQAYMLPQETHSPPAPDMYRIDTNIIGDTAYSTVTPYRSPYQGMADAFGSLAAAFDNIARREKFIENCLVANGWTQVEETAVALTVDAMAVVEPDGGEFSGTATGYKDGTGTIKMENGTGAVCTGNFEYQSSAGGAGLIRCNDGRSAQIRFYSLTRMSGYGSGRTDDGSAVKFTYGLNEVESERYLR